MSLEKIQLPDFLIADLYTHSLVELDEMKEFEAAATFDEAPITDVSAVEAKNIKFLGANAKHIVVLVKDESSDFLNADDLTFLTTILKACRLESADIALVNTAVQYVDLALLQAEFEPKQMLLFNVETTSIKLPFTVPPFQVQPFGGCSYLYGPSLNKIKQPTNEAKDFKVRLWACLKQMFLPS